MDKSLNLLLGRGMKERERESHIPGKRGGGYSLSNGTWLDSYFDFFSCSQSAVNRWWVAQPMAASFNEKRNQHNNYLTRKKKQLQPFYIYTVCLSCLMLLFHPDQTIRPLSYLSRKKKQKTGPGKFATHDG